VAQLGARLDGIEEVVGSNPIGSTICKERKNLPSKSAKFWQLSQVSYVHYSYEYASFIVRVEGLALHPPSWFSQVYQKTSL
jgi:hypothetical protein